MAAPRKSHRNSKAPRPIRRTLHRDRELWRDNVAQAANMSFYKLRADIHALMTIYSREELREVIPPHVLASMPLIEQLGAAIQSS